MKVSSTPHGWNANEHDGNENIRLSRFKRAGLCGCLDGVQPMSPQVLGCLCVCVCVCVCVWHSPWPDQLIYQMEEAGMHSDEGQQSRHPRQKGMYGTTI